MKAFVVLLLLTFAALSADSAQAKSRADRKISNLAVMLPYRPNSEIHTRDRHNNKTWTYDINDESSMENINQELLEALIKERFAQRIIPSEVDQRRTVKRENVDDDVESHESHEDIDEAKIVAIGDETPNDKKTCYKNTCKNVLNAFESALKSQIENYKKCVCKKKPPTKVTITTTEGTTTHTTTASTEKIAARNLDSDDDLIEDALANKDDIICFHRKYDFTLSKLLERIPCQAPPKSNDPVVEELNNEPVKRAERNNNIKKNRNSEADSESIEESVEIDVSELTPKPKTTTSKPLKTKKSDESSDKLNEQIVAILKEHLKSKKPEKSIKKKQTSPRKITIKPRAIAQVEEREESNEPEELDESSHQQFMKQLQELFEKYQVDPDGTFPMQSEERSAESIPSVSPRKSSKKSTIRGTVDESSDESTEAVVKLKTRKAEKKHHKLGDDSGKASKKHNSAVNHNQVANSADNANNNPKKSYRSSARVDDASDDSAEESTVSRSHRNDKKSYRTIEANSSTEKSISNGSNNAKKTNRAGKVSRSSSDDRAASDFAKKISDFARGKPTKSK